MKRYNLGEKYNRYFYTNVPTMVEDVAGEYVKFSDLVELQKKLDFAEVNMCVGCELDNCE